MGSIKVDLPDKLEQRFREEIGRRFSFKKGALSRAATEAVQMWIVAKQGFTPYLYIDDVMGIEMGPQNTLGFLENLVEILKGNVEISASLPAELKGVAKEFTCLETYDVKEEIMVWGTLTPEETRRFFRVITTTVKLDELSLRVEVNGVEVLITGGGCVSIHGNIPSEAKEEVVKFLLESHGRESDYAKVQGKLGGTFQILVISKDAEMIFHTFED